MTIKASLTETYEALRQGGLEELAAGRLEAALAVFDRAFELARESGDQTLDDLASCNRSAVAILLGDGEACIPSLRAMLLRTGDPTVARYSAYNLALAYDRPDGFKKSLFYARIALRYSLELGDPALEASARNQIGNVLVALNDIDNAFEHYTQADEILADADSGYRAQVLTNLGYCQLLDGCLATGLSAVIRAVRMARRHGASLAESHARLCLSFGYLLNDKPAYAASHAATALELAERHGDQRTQKHALLLIGEAYKQGGQTLVARECFELLQTTYYPDMPHVPEMLLDVDVCRVINLRA